MESQGDDLPCYLLRISTASKETGTRAEPGSTCVPDNAVTPQKPGSSRQAQQRGQRVKEICQSLPPAVQSRTLTPRRDECPGDLPRLAGALLSITRNQPPGAAAKPHKCKSGEKKVN